MSWRTWKYVFGILHVWMLLCGGGVAFAVRTAEVELGRDGVYDGQVLLARDPAGRMVFRDAEVTTATALSALLAGAQAHSELTGLGADDHPQYLTESRHADAHSVALNESLAIPTDVNGNTTLGQHTGDTAIHLRRDEPETISGEWEFSQALTVGGGVLRVLPGAPLSPSQVEFGDSPSRGVISFNPTLLRFLLSHDVQGGASAWNSISAVQAMVTGTLSGRSGGGLRIGTLEGFVSVEGIEAGNLLSRVRAESIETTWTWAGGRGVAGARFVSTAGGWEDRGALAGGFSPGGGWSLEPGGRWWSAAGDGAALLVPIAAEPGTTVSGLRALIYSSAPEGLAELSGVTLALVVRDETAGSIEYVCELAAHEQTLLPAAAEGWERRSFAFAAPRVMRAGTTLALRVVSEVEVGGPEIRVASCGWQWSRRVR